MLRFFIYLCFMKSFRAFSKAIPYLIKHGLCRYLLYALLVSIFLEMGVMAATGIAVFKGVEYLVKLFSETPVLWFNFQRDSILETIFSLGVSSLVFISIYQLVRVVNKYILLVLLAPVLSALAERMHEIHHGEAPSSGFGTLWRNALRGASLSLRNFLLETAFTVVFYGAGLAVLFLLPLLGSVFMVAVYVISFGVSAYYYGFGFTDYIWEAQAVARREAVARAKTRKWELIANGGVYQLLTFIPFLSIVFVPLGAVVCTVAAHIAETES